MEWKLGMSSGSGRGRRLEGVRKGNKWREWGCWKGDR